MTHKSGFINILGRPNVGKSTLLNALMGEKMSITTSKPQTTRHRIKAILNDENYQMVFSDTPGVIDDPNYKMQSAMNEFAYSVLEDADILLFVTDIYQVYDDEDKIFSKIKSVTAPKVLLINKADQLTEEKKEKLDTFFEKIDVFDHQMYISALENLNLITLIHLLRDLLPEGPIYYPKEDLSDRSVRFFVSEIIREKLLEQYRQEIPYSTEVVVTEFKEQDHKKGKITHIFAELYVSRKTQKGIIIGKNGEAIKKLATESRKAIELFIDQKVYLELYVRVKDNWRDDDQMLKKFGYKN